jgi:hypothetical protein
MSAALTFQPMFVSFALSCTTGPATPNAAARMGPLRISRTNSSRISMNDENDVVS